MNQAEALQYLQEARPIFEAAAKYGPDKLVDNLQYGQFDLLEALEAVWKSGWSGPEIEAMCDQAGYFPSQVRALSLYFYRRLVSEQEEKIKATGTRIMVTFWVVTGVGAFIVGMLVAILLDSSNSHHVYRSGDGEFYALIGFVVCSPVLGIGYLCRNSIEELLNRWFKWKLKHTWPQGLYPDTEEGRADLEK
ncbi:MAG TPA: hypothetical protein VH186_22275 [Chloroflexia bacterium]|nr:hypothetical protein [Chloroflexia bacterium]